MNDELMTQLIELLIGMRAEARAKKDWATSDKIRDDLATIGVYIQDGKDGVKWTIK